MVKLYPIFQHHQIVQLHQAQPLPLCTLGMAAAECLEEIHVIQHTSALPEWTMATAMGVRAEAQNLPVPEVKCLQIAYFHKLCSPKFKNIYIFKYYIINYTHIYIYIHMV
jgi:hypothetical protein